MYHSFWSQLLNHLPLQILMSVPLILIAVAQMLPVQTFLVASLVLVTWAIVEMDKPVLVSSSFLYCSTYHTHTQLCMHTCTHTCTHIISLQILMSVPLMLIAVTWMLIVPTPLVASSVPVTRAIVEMNSSVWVSSSFCRLKPCTVEL